MKVFHVTEFVYFDDDMLSFYIKYPWGIRTQETKRTKYLVYNGERFHRLVMSAKEGEIVDHIDGNGLNNMRSNLRIISNRLNCGNSYLRRAGKTASKYIGVHAYKVKGGLKYRARYWDKVKGFTSIGTFLTQEEAAKAYDRWVIDNIPAYDGALNFVA